MRVSDTLSETAKNSITMVAPVAIGAAPTSEESEMTDITTTEPSNEIVVEETNAAVALTSEESPIDCAATEPSNETESAETDVRAASTSEEPPMADITAVEPSNEAENEETKAAQRENGVETEEQILTKAPESSATPTSAKTITTSIRDMLCAAPDTGEISGDIDEAQRAFMDMFSREAKEEEVDDGTLDEVTADSDLSNPDRRIWVVTTAALPWRTGTAVNPLLRALYLTRGRPKHYVTLVIPWLNDVNSRTKLYGAQNSFSAGGQKEQEEWIRRYCRERAHCEEEEANMNILFYSAVYQKSFGSIFPTVDICSLIPDNEADVAILDEPEHLNWFRAPPPDKAGKELVAKELKAEGDDASDTETDDESIAKAMSREKSEYGWAFKFRHVIGILHTNYSAYMTQYAIGTSIIAAPAIGMLSSIVVRAYCHRVIRLSAVLPTLAPNKEVTCNVHGVRIEFLQPADAEAMTGTDDTEEEPPARIYYVGKTMWAKGFDKVLEIQDHFRTANGHYFPMDIYGAGPDEKEIKRAFFGRSGKPPKKSSSNESVQPALSSDDAHAAEIFAVEPSLREQVGTMQVETGTPAIEVVPDDTSPTGGSVHIEESPDCSLYDIASADISEQGSSESASEEQESDGEKSSSNPLSVIGDLSSNSVATAVATSQAVYSLADSIVKGGMKMTLTWEKTKTGEASDADGEEKKAEASRFFIDPPKTTYEWRRTPIPARFLGVKDHAELRDIPESNIFLNASVTEVLCTTTAEALAMGKFVIIPKHGEYFPERIPALSLAF